MINFCKEHNKIGFTLTCCDDLENHQEADESQAIRLAVKYCDTILGGNVGLGWDDLGDTVMVSDHISVDMNIDEFKSACKEMCNDKLRDNGAHEELMF